MAVPASVGRVRLFVGADEVLCVKVIARQLVGRHNADK